MEDLSSETRALLERVAAADGPDPQIRERVRVALMAPHLVALLGRDTMASEGTSGIGSFSAAATRIISLATAKKTLISLAVLSALGFLEFAPFLRFSSQSRAPQAVSTTVTESPVAILSSSADVAHGMTEKTNVPVPSSKERPKAPVGSHGPRSNLGEETTILELARMGLRDGRPAESLRAVSQHETRFPNGLLREERIATKILALCAMQRWAEGAKLVTQFSREYSESPLLPRVRMACSGGRDD